MSGSASISLEQAILGHTLGFAQMAFRSPVYVALCSASMPPSETVQGIEAFGGGYTRVRASFALIDAPANIAANTASIEWPIATASWGTLGYFELWDAPTGGNRLYWGPFSPATPVTVSAGDIMRFSASNLAVQASTGTGGTTSIGAYLPLAGGSMGGPLLLFHDPTTYLEAATKQYVDAHSGSGGGPGFLPLSGGTMLGQLALAGNATLPLHAVPLQQVDTLNVVNVLNHGAKGDGITDDTAAIQGVLNTYAGKATVFVPNTSNWYMCNPLTLPSGTDLLLHGSLKLRASAPNSLINITSANQVTVRGHGVLDGNGAAQTVSAPAVSTLVATNCSSLMISGITLQNAHFFNLTILACSQATVDSVALLGGVWASGFAGACNDCWITNSLVDGPDTDYGWAFYGGVTNSGAIGNVFRNAGVVGHQPPPGIGVLSDSGQPAICKNIIIANNVSHSNGGPGIYVDNSVGTLHDGITIANNITYNNSRYPGSFGTANILVNHCKNVTITGNQSSANGVGVSAVCYGIFVGANASNVSVTSNQVFNIGLGATTGVGLAIAGANSVYASGNYFYDTQTTPTMQYSINGQAGTHCAIIGNFCDRPILFTTVADTVMANTVNPGNSYLFGAGTRIVTSVPQLLQNASGAPRWFVGQDGTTEGGSNSGSGFEIVSVADDNASLNNVLTISRATSRVNFAVAPTFTALPVNAANDAAAQAAGLPVGAMYRNGSVLMVRTV